MKTIQFFILLIGMIITSQFAVGQQNAQAEKTPEQKAEERRTTMTKLYKLSDEQGQKVYDATIQFWNTIKEIRESSLSLDEKNKARKECADTFEAKIKEIFTEKQYEKLLEVRAKMKQNAEKKKNKQ